MVCSSVMDIMTTCLDRAGDETGHFLGRTRGYAFVGDLAATPHDDDGVGDGENVRHAVADQHHGDALVAQLPDVVEHLGHLPHRNGGCRLVHQHDLGIGEHGPRDGDRLALPARHLPDQVSRPRLGLQFREELAGAPVDRAIVEDLDRPEADPQLAPEIDLAAAVRLSQSARSWWTISIPCCRASIGGCEHDLPPSSRIGAVARREVSGDHLDHRRLAGPVVPHQPDDFAGLERRTTRR